MANCSHTSAPGDEELVRFAVEEDSLPLEKREHLAQCPICQQRLAEYTRLNNALVERCYRGFCPDGMKLSLYCEDLLSTEERTSIANHVLECQFCATEVAFTRRFIQDSLVTIETGFSPGSAIRRVIGVLTRQQAQVAMHLREGDGPSENGWPRQYRADSFDLSLHLSRTNSGQQILLGILTSVNSEKSVDIFQRVVAELYAGPLSANIEQQALLEPIQGTQLDDLGNLVFHNVANGKYVLVIHLPDQDIVIEQINIEQN